MLCGERGGFIFTEYRDTLVLRRQELGPAWPIDAVPLPLPVLGAVFCLLLWLRLADDQSSAPKTVAEGQLGGPAQHELYLKADACAKLHSRQVCSQSRI